MKKGTDLIVDKKILVISPGIEDSGIRGLGVVTLALINGLSDAGYTPYLLTGAPIKSINTKNTNVAATAKLRYLNHYLLDGYKSKAYKLNKKKIIKYIFSDLLKLVARRPTIIQHNSVLPTTHAPNAVRRFENVRGFVNFAFIYKLSSFLPEKISSYVILSIAKKAGIGTIITASPFPLSKSFIEIYPSPKIIQYVHDVMPLNILETPPDLIDKFSAQLEKSLLNADLILASSNNTKNKIEKLYPDLECNLTYLPCEPPKSYQAISRFGMANQNLIAGKYFLFMSTVEERKNITRLIQAFEQISHNNNIKLVIVGSKGYGWDDVERLLKKIRIDIKKRIIFTGYIPEEDKWDLIKNCLAVVHPAIDEGLGIPVIEGIVASKPVIATRLPSIEEVSPPGCVKYIEDPYSVHEIAEKLKSVISKKDIDENSIKLGSVILKERFSNHAFAQRLHYILSDLKK